MPQARKRIRIRRDREQTNNCVREEEERAADKRDAPRLLRKPSGENRRLNCEKARRPSNKASRSLSTIVEGLDSQLSYCVDCLRGPGFSYD